MHDDTPELLRFRFRSMPLRCCSSVFFLCDLVIIVRDTYMHVMYLDVGE
jgi:hypothetical protein